MAHKPQNAKGPNRFVTVSAYPFAGFLESRHPPAASLAAEAPLGQTEVGRTPTSPAPGRRVNISRKKKEKYEGLQVHE